MAFHPRKPDSPDGSKRSWPAAGRGANGRTLAPELHANAAQLDARLDFTRRHLGGSHTMKWGAALALGLLTAAVVGGCGSTRTVSTTDTTYVTATVTNPTKTIARTTVTQPARTVTQTTTETQTQVVTRLPTPTRSFSGNGGENLGTIHVSQNSTVRWTNDGALFQILAFGINSQGHSGTSALSSGSYPNVEVNALGNWTIQILPG
jgi:hypothetical protein